MHVPAPGAQSLSPKKDQNGSNEGERICLDQFFPEQVNIDHSEKDVGQKAEADGNLQ